MDLTQSISHQLWRSTPEDDATALCRQSAAGGHIRVAPGEYVEDGTCIEIRVQDQESDFCSFERTSRNLGNGVIETITRPVAGSCTVIFLGLECLVCSH